MKEIDSLIEALELKDEKRTGWELRNIEKPESVADHSWGTALLCLVFSDQEDVDRDRCVEMAVVHDLGEAEIGDIPKRAVDVESEIDEREKAEKEEETVTEFSEKLSDSIRKLWQEYEDRDSPEAQFVKDMDLIDMCLQALKYEKQGRYDPEEENENFQEYENLDEFFATTEPRLNTETGKHLFQEIKSQYEKARNQ